ncbi:hypothetical protein TVAG_029410 [Trichomonas vaginalis G3]|uniref:Uncharacterized protein n=1 Tax=Trichomonas vaginalis (strain ATCC PRA-98 / G3) TaxID=412133 RepID=A2G946_TRIV3|nr:hypothetical protein TVAGG3_0926020 [Trichomonas vaginalis G3]EAX86319.1 hypothetical protein TVAG_029410 [Trichomonas vaginalis G3]KAI5485479.1 hypothetical protein TVAGG3_0926020 [Trichomonas vaginalis G3]|eukprot:XP_001299249.1 hypothetical protein [Trichomonas vaginalis G3]
MDPFIYDEVIEIFNKFAKRPTSRLLYRFGHEANLTIKMEDIQDRLVNKKYASPFDFAIDVREILYRAQEKYVNDVRTTLVLEDISLYFEKKAGSIPRTRAEKLQKLIKKDINKFSLIKRAMSLSAYSPQVSTPIPAKIPVSKSVHGPPAPLVQEIQRLINEVTDVSVLAEMCRILKTHIPGFELQETTTIDVKNLSAQCIEDLRNLLTKSKK